MTSTSTFIITNEGLLKVCKEIINQRSFNEDLISVTGEPVISKGIASELSDTSYFYRDDLNFSMLENLIISFRGNFLPSEYEQYAWYLYSKNSILSLSFTNSSLLLKFNNTIIKEITNLKLNIDTSINVTVKMDSENYEISLLCGNKYIVENGELLETVPYTSLENLVLGKNPSASNSFWNGKINLPYFLIGSNSTTLYSPSSEEAFNFTKVMVSDGKFPLSDTSYPVFGHVYESEVSEISRSGNSVLFSSNIGSDVHLIIKEIGLYAATEKGEILFSVIRDLNIYKEEDLDYDLIFNLDLSISVVNVTGFPVTGSFVVKEPEYGKYENFLTLKYVIEYVISLLEKIIDLNATALGYNREQEYYRFQQEIEFKEDAYNAAQAYSKIKNKILDYIPTKELDEDSFEIHGNAFISKDGTLTLLDNEGYVTSDINPISNSIFREFTCSFTPYDNSQQYIGNIGGYLNYQAISVFSDNGYCGVQLGRPETITTNYLNATRTYTRDLFKDDISNNRFAWSNSNYSNYYNLHSLETGYVTDSPYLVVDTVPFDTLWNNFNWNKADWNSNAYLLNHPNFVGIDENNWKLSIKFKLDNSSSSLRYLIGSFETGASLQVYIDNNKLKATLYFASDTPSSSTMTLTQNLSANTDYIVHLDFNGSLYSLYYTLATSTTPVETATLSTSKKIKTGNPLCIGANYNGSLYSDPLMGTIDMSQFTLYSNNKLIWIGASKLGTVYTEIVQPSADTLLYDSSGEELYDYPVQAYSGGYFYNKNNVFPVTLNSKNYLKIRGSKDGNSYTYNFYSSTNGDDWTLVDALTSSYAILEPDMVNIGNNLSGTTRNLSLINGSTNLLDWEFKTNKYTWKMYTEIIKYATKLLQFYHFPKENRSSYIFSDIENSDYTMTVLEDTFKGNKDLINFKNENGFCLSVKVHLKDVWDKTILVKQDSSNNIYFIFDIVNKNLRFRFFTEDNIVTLSKKLEDLDYLKFEEEPILLTIMYNGSFTEPEFKLYRNNELITTYNGYLSTFISNVDEAYFLSNETELTENPEIYVSDILAISGKITPEQLYYITNIMDTNY